MKKASPLSELHLQNLRMLNQDDNGTASAAPQYRTIFISDVHLGTKDCKAAQLNAFLKQYSCERLYLVGDIFDGWRMRDGVFWTASFNRVLRRLLKLAKRGVEITYITGNHDEFLRKYANISFDNIHLCNRATHITADHRKLLIIHGDQFEGVARCSRWLRHIGDHGYALLMLLNRWFNRLRAKYGYGYWSFSGFLKQHINRAQTYISDYEHAVAYGAKKQGFDGVVCGHIHHAAHRHLLDVDYYNTGDWVESCTAVVEDFAGHMHVMYWLQDPNHQIHSKALKRRLTLAQKALRQPRKTPLET